MALVTITEASKLTGKARKTLYAHLKQGKLSSRLQNDGTKQIDTSELIRVYGELKPVVTEVTPPDVPEGTPSNVTKSTAEELIRAIEMMRDQQELDRKENVLLRKQLMELTEKVSSLTNILEHKPELVVQEVKSSGSALAAKAVEAAISTSAPSPSETKKDGTRSAALVDSNGYLEIPVFGRS